MSDGQPCCPFDGNPVAAEIDGRVLVCADCATDPDLLAHAREDWR